MYRNTRAQVFGYRILHTKDKLIEYTITRIKYTGDRIYCCDTGFESLGPTLKLPVGFIMDLVINLSPTYIHLIMYM